MRHLSWTGSEKISFTQNVSDGREDILNYRVALLATIVS